jgi:hypothetical protein
VHGLRERDGRDPEEGEHPVHPPVRCPGRLRRRPVEAELPEALAGEPPDGRPDFEVGVVGCNAERFE